VKIQQGIPIEKAKEIVKFIKDEKLKVQASIQGETVRVSGKDRDTLQDTIAKLKAKDFGIDMQFDNYRSNWLLSSSTNCKWKINSHFYWFLLR